jgi:dUTP pyrophosphatase
MTVMLYRRDGAAIPKRGSDEAAGYDLTADIQEDLLLMPLAVMKVPTGVFIAQQPGSVCLACCRSGLAAKGVHIVNAPGIIDSDYRGELFTLLTYIAHPNAQPFIIKPGDRIAQLLFVTPGVVSMDVSFVEVKSLEDLSKTGRGADGFGSTGR